jgi:hypothetical protein
MFSDSVSCYSQSPVVFWQDTPKEEFVKRNLFLLCTMLAAVALFATYQVASAHTTVSVGDYNVEVGWIDEPPVVGQRNAIVVNVENTKSTDAQVDVSKLTVAVTYGGQTKNLTLEPLSEDTVNQYIAPILPMVAGQYTVQLRGQLDTTDVTQDVQPEEVVSDDEIAFPSASAEQTPAAPPDYGLWLGVVALIVAVVALLLALRSPRKSS